MSGRPNDGLFAFLDKAGSFILANLLWVILSIPIVTLPAVTAGLFTSTLPWVRGEPGEVFKDFFSGIRQHWKQASAIGLIDVFLAGLVILNFSIFRLMNMSQPLSLLSQSMTLFIGLMGFAANLYIWPLMVIVEKMPLRSLLDMSIRLVFIHPAWTLVILVLAVVPLAANLFLPGAFFMLATFSSCALLVNWGAWRILKQYVTEETQS